MVNKYIPPSCKFFLALKIRLTPVLDDGFYCFTLKKSFLMKFLGRDFLTYTRNPASWASKRARLVAIRPMSVHRKSFLNNNNIVKKAYIFHVPPVMQ